MKIRHIEASDYFQVSKIYLEGIATGVATFQTDAQNWEEWDKSHLSYCRLAMMDNEKMLGWAALSPVSSRCVYVGVSELSIYISENARGKGIGTYLLSELKKESELRGLWTLQSGILPENIGSIALHEKCGFRKIGYREKIGKLHGVWKDNIIMERRSKIVGI